MKKIELSAIVNYLTEWAGVSNVKKVDENARYYYFDAVDPSGEARSYKAQKVTERETIGVWYTEDCFWIWLDAVQVKHVLS